MSREKVLRFSIFNSHHRHHHHHDSPSISLAHFFAFSCINCLLCKLLLVSSLDPELAKPRSLAHFTTKQDEKMVLKEYLEEKIMLRSYMMIFYPASRSPLNSER